MTLDPRKQVMLVLWPKEKSFFCGLLTPGFSPATKKKALSISGNLLVL
jgi:hypothetical protein